MNFYIALRCLKKVQIIFLLALYVAVIFKPLLPYVDFVINKERITTVLCENKDKQFSLCGGVCYLNKNLKVAYEEEESSSSTKLKVKTVEEVHNKTELVLNFSAFSEGTTICHSTIYNEKLSANHYSLLSPPPKFLA